MSQLDLILRGGQVVMAESIQTFDVGIADGKIAALAASIHGSARAEIRADGLYLFPGVIDAHVHFNEPGRENWEGISTGSRALAAGGGTVYFDMPLNAHPPTCDVAAFELKLAAAQAKSVTDFALWGGLVPGNLNQLEPLAHCGVIGFKAFMANSGIDDFAQVDSATLRAGMQRAAALRLPVAVHAESELITRQLTLEKLAAGKTTVKDYLASRPIQAELEAIRCALDLAGETQCALHVVHVSSGAGVDLIAAARQQGVNVTCETCPHYLTLTDQDMEQIGPLAKCAPPLRPATVVAELWQRLADGRIDTVGSDHSPAPAEMKTSPNFFKVWGGISGVQHTLPLLIDGTQASVSALSRIAAVTAEQVARRFRLATTKGRIAVGHDADLVLVDLTAGTPVHAAGLFYRHPHTPYQGRTLQSRVLRTWLRGQAIYQDGRPTNQAHGRLLKPL
ncbi:MAG TPA: allantoinase AllB [Verrucomicrobiae bacterium]